MNTNIEELTLGQLREIGRIISLEGYGKTNQELPMSPYRIGKNYFIRTVTFHYTGKLIEVGNQELILTNCAWIADSGRFTQAIRKGEYNEVEPFPEDAQVIIGRNTIVDAVMIETKLPISQK